VFDSRLEFQKVSDDRMTFVVGRKLASCFNSGDLRENLAAIPLLTYSLSSTLRVPIDRLILEQKLAFKCLISVDSVDGILALAVQDCGGAFVLHSLAEGLLRSKQLSEIKMPFEVPSSTVMMVLPPGGANQSVVNWIVQLIKQGPIKH
jgi:DNA-binding transcriptional LysR family regulator